MPPRCWWGHTLVLPTEVELSAVLMAIPNGSNQWGPWDIYRTASCSGVEQHKWTTSSGFDGGDLDGATYLVSIQVVL